MGACRCICKHIALQSLHGKHGALQMPVDVFPDDSALCGSFSMETYLQMLLSRDGALWRPIDVSRLFSKHHIELLDEDRV